VEKGAALVETCVTLM
jgi:hypothetical protein